MNVRIKFPSFFAVSMLAFTAGVLTPLPATAATLDMPNVPLPVNIGSTSNIFLEMDDSGSMDRDILTPQHFTTCMYNSVLNCSTVFMFEHMLDVGAPVSWEGVSVAACESWDLNCNGICEVSEQSASWDTNCNGTCDTATETCSVCEVWDTNCDGICDASEQSATWDTNCNGICDTATETCTATCAFWDSNCNGICDASEQSASWDTNCNGICDSASETCTSACLTWDVNCDGICDASEQSANWDTNCNGICDSASELCSTSNCESWDANCNGFCDQAEEDANVCPEACDEDGDFCYEVFCDAWDVNCDGICDFGESCPGSCAIGTTCSTATECTELWDLDADCQCDSNETCPAGCAVGAECGSEAAVCTYWDNLPPPDGDCDGVCDFGEICPAGCNIGEICFTCAAWDTNCDGICDASEQSATWDTNCSGVCESASETCPVCAAWDTNCDGICDVLEQSATWDTNCNSLCDASEQSTTSDTNCNGVCDASEQSDTWDTNCNSICDASEQSDTWDTNCNGTCDTSESCSSSCEAWDTNCNGICDAVERSDIWDTNCNGTCDTNESCTSSCILGWDLDCDGICDANEQFTIWDTNCNGLCDASEQTISWDTNCNGICDSGEIADCSAPFCHPWDLNCNSVCDSGEDCPEDCAVLDECNCFAWDGDCDGFCDFNEPCGTTDACEEDFPDCHCPASDPYCISRGTCPISDPNCNCPVDEEYCNTQEEEPICPSTIPDCNCPSSDPFCVTRGSCPVSDPNCACPGTNPDCVTNAMLDDGAVLVSNIGDINSLINNYLAVSASVQPSASQRRRNSEDTPTRISDGPPEIPQSGGPPPPPSLPEDKSRRSRTQDHADSGTNWTAVFEYFHDTSDNVLSASNCSSGANRNTYEVCFNGTNEDYFDWRARSSDLNVLFFNPNATYTPWVGDVGFTDASFLAARSQPVSTLSGYTVTRNMSGFFYMYWIDDRGYVGSQPNGSNATDVGNKQIDQWDSHVKVTVSSSSYRCDLFNYSPDITGLNLQISSLATTHPLCIEAFGVNPDLISLQQNVANWFQYYRKRVLVAKAAVSAVVTDQRQFRYGLGEINTGFRVPMPSASITDYTAHNAQLIKTYQDSSVGGSTPLRRGLETVGKYYAGNLIGESSPIIQACQKNFSILFSDGFWNRSDPGTPSGDFDVDGGTIAGTDILLADVAKYFYDTDLAPQFDNVVVADDWDTATHQHMVTYTIGFGVTGLLTDTDADGWPNDFDPFTYTGPWYLTGSSDDQKKIDDMWHAAWNGRGAYYSAKRPEQLVQALTIAIEDIGNRSGSSASAASTGGSLTALSQIYQSKYDSADWHGELLAFPVNSNNGDFNAVSWEAGALLNAQPESYFANQAGGRQMFTWNSSTNSGSTFTWVGLNAAQQAVLDKDPITGSADGEGQARVQYIRGSAIDEGTGNNYRRRINRLGDLIHSDLQFVKEPPFFYPFDNYQTFASTWADRTAMLYVGGNDGMLHAFRVDTGAEVFAYVPNEVMPRLNQLTNPFYSHQFYVDGPMDYGDVYIGAAWKSVLAGSMRSGGQAVYALDITDPLNFSAGNVLWEFSDEDDADLGFFMGRPQIKKMANGKWAVIVSSGYNNTEVDGPFSLTGNSYIFVLYIADGMNGWSSSDYVKILVSGADGLSTPAVADVDGDGVSDFIYVGDINGNMWKIDVTNTSSSFWNVAFSGNPLFTATESIADGGSPQPITAQPAIKTHPLGIGHGVLVMWGTGKYYEISDDTVIDQPTQSIYAVWDRDGYYNLALNARNSFNERGFSRETDLVSPKIIVDVASNTRIIDPDSLIDASGNPITPLWYNADGTPHDRGWVVDLPEAGERVTQKIVLRDDLAFFVTLIPEESPCVPGSSGWLMVLNAETGSSPLFPVFDINDDNVVDSSDVLTVGDSLGNELTTQAAGVAMQSMPSLPVFLYDDRPADLGEVFPPSANSPRSCGSAGARTFTYTTQADGSMVKITTAPQPLACGRQNWIQQR